MMLNVISPLDTGCDQTHVCDVKHVTRKHVTWNHQIWTKISINILIVDISCVTLICYHIIYKLYISKQNKQMFCSTCGFSFVEQEDGNPSWEWSELTGESHGCWVPPGGGGWWGMEKLWRHQLNGRGIFWINSIKLLFANIAKDWLCTSYKYCKGLMQAYDYWSQHIFKMVYLEVIWLG